MKAIEDNVGPYRPIMQPNVERLIADAHRGRTSPADMAIELEEITAAVTMNLDLLNSEIERHDPVALKVTPADLNLILILNTPSLMPEGWTAMPAGQDARGRSNHWRVTNPAGQQWTVTTDREAHQYAPDRLELWGRGSPSFP